MGWRSDLEVTEQDCAEDESDSHQDEDACHAAAHFAATAWIWIGIVHVRLGNE